MMEFPSPIERTVASSLLLLSFEPVYFSPTRSGSVEESSYVKKWCDEGSSNLSLIVGSSGSRSCNSVLSSDFSFGKSTDRGFEVNYTGDRFRFVDFKIARKRRSQVIWGSLNVKPTHFIMSSVCDLSTCSDDSKDESSCLSTGSSEVSSRESRIKFRNQNCNDQKLRVGKKKMNKESSRSSSIRRRAEDILAFLSSASSSEVKIRQILGDSPDTSKALRMLLKMAEVKRFGTGGRLDPYIYKIA